MVALQVVGLCALPGLAATPQAPPSQPSFPAETEIVTVDVVVADRRGEPVRTRRLVPIARTAWRRG
jgi:hypothetical protein